MRQDARPHARKNRRRIHRNTLRVFQGRERRGWLRTVHRNRTVYVEQAPSLISISGYHTKDEPPVSMKYPAL